MRVWEVEEGSASLCLFAADIKTAWPPVKSTVLKLPRVSLVVYGQQGVRIYVCVRVCVCLSDL